jgi:hypothetical protein
MKPLLFAAAFAFTLAACTTTSSGPATAWGKEGMTMKDYRYDGVQCAVIAAKYDPQDNGSNTAGGINGANGSAPVRGGDSAAASGPSTGSTSVSPTGGSGVYRDMANPDLVQRAATQQRAREMATQRARTQALKGCLTERGYKEFQLTAEQRAHLATLPEGSDERREYLFKLGADPEVLNKQPAVKSGS